MGEREWGKAIKNTSSVPIEREHWLRRVLSLIVEGSAEGTSSFGKVPNSSTRLRVQRSVPLVSDRGHVFWCFTWVVLSLVYGLGLPFQL